MRDAAPTPRYKLIHTATIVIMIVVFYGIVFTTPMLRHISTGVDTVQKILAERQPIDQEIQPAIDVSLTSQKNNDDYVAPMWSCKDTDRKKKLVFSHIFKTAGSSMRSLLRSYAETCNAGYVTVINCGAVRLDSLHSGNWQKDEEYRKPLHGTQCKLKQTIFRNNTVIADTGTFAPINTTYLEEANVDILSGHVSVGIDDNWKDDRGQHVDVQYLTFFRESTHKFVSAVLYLRPKLSFEEAVAHVKETAKRRLEDGAYLTDIANMMTPVQRAELRKNNITLSYEEGANLMIQNLKEKNILVGIVERMSESLEMLQHVVDKDGELDSMFEEYGKLPPGATTTKEIKANKSRLSSSEVLAEVEKDKDFMTNVMQKFVKWDSKVYQYALDMHLRQYEAYKQRNPTVAVKANTGQTRAAEVDRIEETEASSRDGTALKPDEKTMEGTKEIDSLPSVPKTEETPSTTVSSLGVDFNPEIKPMWSCSDTDRKQKLSFVHIFKTAGSSMRRLLRAYAERCGAGAAIVVNCAPVDPVTIETGNWAKKSKDRSHKHGVNCKLKNTIFRNGTAIQHSPGPGHDVPINTTYLEASDIDILGGHITMGVDEFWKDGAGKRVDMQYLSFFRESTRKVVSAVLFMNPKLSFDDAVQNVKDRVRQNVAKSLYLDNSNYIITPAQARELKNVTTTPEDRANLMIRNLKENKVLFGIVERMSESLEMLQHVIDKDGELDSMFESFGKIPPGTNKTEEIIMNKSKLSSSSVLAEVEKDEDFMKTFREYTKWDNKVYRFALDMHMRQYESYKQQTLSRTVKSVEQAHQLPSPVERVEASESAIAIAPKLDDYKGEIKPLWTCKDKDRTKKLVFVHVFKTAGSSMRKLLRTYALSCDAGLALAIRCAPVLPESIQTGTWIRDDDKNNTCVLADTTYRNNTIDKTARPMNTKALEDSNADILGGHITLGTEYDWKDDNGDHVDVQHFTFFRESKRKYVSSVLYLHPKLTFDEAVARVKVAVFKKVKTGKYLDSSGYLITPQQRAEHRNVTLTTKQSASLIMKNLKEKNVLVGIVERMSESLEMLQRIVDQDGELDSTFEAYGKIPPGTNKTTKVIANKSKLSSEAVLAEVEKDDEFMKAFQEFVKYDNLVYRFALDMHMRQYESAFQIKTA